MQIHVTKPEKNTDVDSHFHCKKSKQIRSIFSYMHTRHNVMTKEQAEKGNSQANQNGIYRIYEWNEKTKDQKYDHYPIAPKIGSIY